ncbi:MAG: VOC family protein, partial [Bacteroidales bacterium]
MRNFFFNIFFMITHLEHIGLSVSNLERSVDFYREHLNCELIRILEVGDDLPLGRVTGLPGCRARIAHLQLGGVMLELFEYTQPRGREIPADHR